MTRHRNQHRLHLAVWLAWLLMHLCCPCGIAADTSCGVEVQCHAAVEPQEPEPIDAVAPAAVVATASGATAADEPVAGVTAAPPASATTSEPRSTSGFPSGNKAVAVTGKWFQELLTGLSGHSGANSSLVTLFYLADGCPHSKAVKPVFECLPAFFPKEIPFVSVSHREMSLVSLMTHGIHALPVVQVNAHGRKYRYSGKHWLAPLVQFVSKALGVEPLASTEVAMLCSNKSDTHSSQHCMAEDIWNYSSSSSSSGEGVDRSRTCPIVAGNSAEQEQQQQQQESLCSGWICDRWDGDATTAELTAQQHGRLFHFSVTFLVCRLLWWVWSRMKRRKAAAAAAALIVERPESAAEPPIQAAAAAAH